MSSYPQVWSRVSSLRFTQVTNPNVDVDIDIEFGVRSHGDQSPFDGPSSSGGSVLAHAFIPNPRYSLNGIPGDAHFDDDEQYTMNTNAGKNDSQLVRQYYTMQYADITGDNNKSF